MGPFLSSPATVTLGQDGGLPLSVQHTSPGGGLPAPGLGGLQSSVPKLRGWRVAEPPTIAEPASRPTLPLPSPGMRAPCLFLLAQVQNFPALAQTPVFPPPQPSVIAGPTHSFNPVCAGFFFSQATSAPRACGYSDAFLCTPLLLRSLLGRASTPTSSCHGFCTTELCEFFPNRSSLSGPLLKVVDELYFCGLRSTAPECLSSWKRLSKSENSKERRERKRLFPEPACALDRLLLRVRGTLQRWGWSPLA